MNYAVGQAQACSAPGRSHSKWEILSEGGKYDGMFVGRLLPRVSIAAEFHKRLCKGFQDSIPTPIKTPEENAGGGDDRTLALGLGLHTLYSLSPFPNRFQKVTGDPLPS